MKGYGQRPSGRYSSQPGGLIFDAHLAQNSVRVSILKPVSSWIEHGNFRIGAVREAVIIGILAETRYAPIRLADGTTQLSFAGLGLAFDGETIHETIQLFRDIM